MALDCYFESIKHCKESNNYLTQFISLGNIGNMYLEIGEEKKANHYYNLSTKLAEEHNLPNTANLADLALGKYYMEQNNFTKAQQHLQNALSKINSSVDKSVIYGHSSACYAKEGKYEKAIEATLAGIKVAEPAGSFYELGNGYLDYANLLYLSDSLIKCEKLLVKMEAENISRFDNYNLKDFYIIKAKNNKALKKHKSRAEDLHQVVILQF